MADFDVLIVGGGIAGASLGAEIAGAVRTVIIEAESHCGMHATGRSAAFWLESYGGPEVALLSAASRDFLANPPSDFSEHGFLRDRGDVHLTLDELPTLPPGVVARVVERDELEQLVPGIRPQWRRRLFEPGCADIDVAALHAAYLRRFRGTAARCRPTLRLESAAFGSGVWTVRLSGGSTVTASMHRQCRGRLGRSGCGSLRGAPAGHRAQAADDGPAPRRPLAACAICRSSMTRRGTFYFKGEGDRSIWLSPHDEIASDPCDAAPEEIDVATAIDRFEQVVDWPVEAVERSWAGLRSFAPDRMPVYGFDPGAPAFFWCVGQGGFGIQTAPAAARLRPRCCFGASRMPRSLISTRVIFSRRRGSVGALNLPLVQRLTVYDKAKACAA